MSVLDVDRIDDLATANMSKTLIMLISDHLDWSDEYGYLIALQNKINSYISFVEEKQYLQIEQFGKHFENFVIEIAFKFSPMENCLKFISSAEKQIMNLKISIQC